MALRRRGQDRGKARPSNVSVRCPLRGVFATVSETLTSTQTWTAPANVGAIRRVQCWGAGGAGGVSVSSEGGGGGGAYAEVINTPVIPGRVYTATVPAGAAPGMQPTDGTWFNAATVVFADYGRSGAGRNAGAGGAVANSIGSTKFAGGAGGTSSGIGTGGSGGGSSAGPSVGGNNGTSIGSGSTGGAGGNAVTGGGAGGAGGNNTANGTNGSTPAGGAGGGGAGGGNGGTGGNGKIILTYS